MPTLLALDTTTGACSAALLQPRTGAVLSSRYEEMARGHAEALAPMVQEVMAGAGLPMSAIDRLAVTTGPGTFTGCRIGLAFARALGTALDCPVLGVPTLQAIAAHVFENPDHDDREVAALMDARRGEVYLQIFSADGRPLSEACVCPLDEAARRLTGRPHVLAGTGADLVMGMASGELWTRARTPDFPDARLVARLAARLSGGDTMPRPFYLRAPDAKLPKNKPQLRAGAPIV